MTTFTIPLIGKIFYIYVGKKEWHKYRIDVSKEDSKIDMGEYPGEDSGRSNGGWIWIDNTKDKNLIYHELSHLIDDVMELINSHDKEFRAYISAWIYDSVLRWAK